MKITKTSDGGVLLSGVKVGKEKKTFAFGTGEGVADLRLSATGKTLNPDVRNLTLPGEWELQGALIKGVYSDNRENILFKVTVGDLTFVDCGTLRSLPSTETLAQLGESVTIAVVRVSATFDAKTCDKLLDTISAPVTLVLCGGEHQMAVINETGATVLTDAYTVPKPIPTESEHVHILA